MKRVTLSTGKSVIVNDEQAAKLEQALVNGTPYVRLNGELYKSSVVLAVETVGAPSLMTPSLPAPATELTEEQRQRNLERINGMRREFLANREAKR